MVVLSILLFRIVHGGKFVGVDSFEEAETVEGIERDDLRGEWRLVI